MNTAEVLDCTIDVYKKSFWKQLAFSAVISVVSTIFLFIFGIFALIFFAAIATAVNFTAAPNEAIIFIIMFVSVFGLIFLWQTFIGSGHILMAKSAFFNEGRSQLPEKFLKAIPRVLSVIVAQALVYLPYITICSYIIWQMFLHVENVPTMNTAPIILFIIAIFMLMLVFVVGFFILANIMALSVAVSIFEKRLFFGAITRSLQLMRGKFWLIFATRIVWNLIVFVLSMSFYTIFSIALAAIEYLGNTTNILFILATIIITIVSYIVSIFASLAAMPLEGIFNAVIYFNQRIKNEGLDIELEIERLKS